MRKTFRKILYTNSSALPKPQENDTQIREGRNWLFFKKSKKVMFPALATQSR